MKFLMDRFHIKLRKHPKCLVPINSTRIKTIISNNANHPPLFSHKLLPKNFLISTNNHQPNIHEYQKTKGGSKDEMS